MAVLYGALFGMFLMALGFFLIPFLKDKNFAEKKYFLGVTLFLFFFTSIFYYFASDQRALAEWLNKGKSHYALLAQFEHLGGTKGAILKIRERLAKNPEDAKGWLLLGKLYLTEENLKNAHKAFKKAHVLQPEDKEITYYYEATQMNSPF